MEFTDVEEDMFEDDLNNKSIGHNTLPFCCLECHGETFQCTPNSIPEDVPANSMLRSNSLHVLFISSLHHKSLLENLENVELFNGVLDPSLALLNNNEMLFKMARKYFFILESDAIKINATIGPTNRKENRNYFKIREELSLFFSYIRSYLLSIQENNDFKWLIGELAPQVFSLLKQWRLLLQGFCDLPHNIVKNCPSQLGNKCMLPSYHMFHCHLENRWYYTTLLFALARCSKYLGVSQALEKDLSLFIAELVFIAEGIFASSALQSEDKIFRLSPFLCTCVQEMWLMLQLLTDKLHSSEDISKPFWGLLETELTTYIKAQHTQVQKNEDCSQLKWPSLGKSSNIDHSSMCLWLFLHLTKLYGFSENGLYMDVLRHPLPADATTLLEEILKAMLPNSEEIKEARLREIMQVLLVLPRYWPTGISPILVLWEVFLRRINSFFILDTDIPSTIAVVGKNVADFVLQVKAYLSSTEERDETENSYCMFLRLLGSQLEAMVGEPDLQERTWRQLKGRIYPKFPPTRLQTLSEIGLHHLSSLMLTLALAIDLNEVGEKLQQMLSSVPKTRESGKRAIIWKVHLALLYLRAEKGLSLNASAEPLVELLTDTSSKLTVFSTPEIELMRMYVEALQDIAETVQRSSVSIHVLIGKWLPRYLEICSTPDACRTLDALQAVTNKLKLFDSSLLSGNTGEQELFAALKEHALPYLMQQSSTPNAPAQKIADLAVSITLGAPDTDFIQLLNHFISSESVNVRITARFLTQLLPNKQVMERVKSKMPNYHNVIIQTWVKCCLLASDNRAEMGQLTRTVAKLPQLVTLCGGSTELLLTSPEPLDALAHLLDSRFQTMEFLRDKQQLKEQTLACLGRIDKVAEAALKNRKLPASLITRLYRTTGVLVQTCAPLLYSKNINNCLMKGIISHLLLPMSIFKADSDFHPESALRHTLPLFLKGIVRLGPKHDIYIARTIREIVMQYVPRLAPERGADHPLMECLKVGSELSLAILDGIKVSFFGKKLRNLPHGALQSLELLQSLLLLRGHDEWLVRETVNVMLEPLLNQMMCLEDNSVDKKEVSNTIREMVCSSAFRESQYIQSIFDNCMKKFYGLLSFHMVPMFRILMWLTGIRRSLLVPTLTDLRTEVANVEKLRGVGRDTALRGHLEKLEAELAT